MLSNGHCLLVGVPGLAKTLLISTLARVLDLKFSRIQFTPDLMPSDITGTEILEENKSTGQREFKFVKGSGICEHSSCRRSKPYTPQDASGAASGDAGARSDGIGPDIQIG